MLFFFCVCVCVCMYMQSFYIIFYVSLSYQIVGLRMGADHIFAYMAVIVLVGLFNVGFGFMIGVISVSVMMSNVRIHTPPPTQIQRHTCTHIRAAYAHIYICTHSLTHSLFTTHYTHTHTHTYTYIYIHTYTHVHTPVRTPVRTHTRTYINVYVRMCVCVRECRF